MRLGGSIVGPYPGAEAWTAMAKVCGFRAVTFPLDWDAGTGEIDRLVKELKTADIKIAEVGAWANNPLAQDLSLKRKAIENCKKKLELAEYVGACCCVNVAGSHAAQWDSPCTDGLSKAFFDEVVAAVQEIIDGVKPKRTFYTLEPMPFFIPDSPDSYLQLIHAVNRTEFAVHLDIVNMINSPQRYYNNSAFIQECFDKLGSYIKSIHIKDSILRNTLTVHLDECLVGSGALDLACVLRNSAQLSADIPVLVEHIHNQEDYKYSINVLHTILKDIER
ncbi:MAG: sugar phosphate isomerase/epimerase [Treponema sp.]|jgi:sugar phosphate isomerase/epimerase|nr:sugar phosphate isomerase/epimerase [Treponema sp.]